MIQKRRLLPRIYIRKLVNYSYVTRVLSAIALCTACKMSGGNHGMTRHALCTAPRRMFLCDVPLYAAAERGVNASSNAGVGIDYVRLMGTVVEIISQSPHPSCSDINRVKYDSENNTTRMPSDVNVRETIDLIYFVIDDGTEIMEVVTERRVHTFPINNHRSNNCATIFHPTTQQHQMIGQSSTLESILSAPPPPIMVGQTVDCIGRIQIDDVEGVGAPCVNGTSKQRGKRIYLVASSVSPVKSPQAMTLRHLELSSSPRWKNTISNGGGRLGRNNNNFHTRKNVNLSQNRILVGGILERKLNPLYHCDRDGSVVFDMDAAFNYIKLSKDDGGITQKELASLVGAVEPNEILAVNLVVEQLREECRIYINRNKWFPM